MDVWFNDVMMSQLNYVAGAHLNAGEEPRRLAGGAHPYIVPAQVFETQDGYLALFITHDGFWRKFALEAEKPEWLTDVRFATMGITGRAAEEFVTMREKRPGMGRGEGRGAA